MAKKKTATKKKPLTGEEHVKQQKQIVLEHMSKKKPITIETLVRRTGFSSTELFNLLWLLEDDDKIDTVWDKGFLLAP
jgi:hypothetical protein